MKKTTTTKFRALSVVALAAFISVQSFVMTSSTYAAQINTRSLTLQANGTTGGSTPGGVVNHFFQFTVPTAASVGSIKFEYCTTAADVGTATCVAPAGIEVGTPGVGSESGWTGVGLNATRLNDHAYYISKASATAVSANTVLSYQFTGITNPATPNSTFFVRITTHASTDATGGAIDSGTVAAATANQLQLSGIMPESLVFCTGETVPLPVSNVPDCANAIDSTIAFNQLFSPTDTAWAKSQMAASTNAGFGYAITVNGPTLSSSSNFINPMTSATTSVPGTSQFGLNLVENLTTISSGPLGAAVAPATDSVNNYRGQPAAGFNTAETFQFNSGDTVAASDAGGAGGSNGQVYTVSYIVNVPGSQPAGTYATTLTYICTPTY